MFDSFPLLHCVSLSFIKGIYIVFLVMFFKAYDGIQGKTFLLIIACFFFFLVKSNSR